MRITESWGKHQQIYCSHWPVGFPVGRNEGTFDEASVKSASRVGSGGRCIVGAGGGRGFGKGMGPIVGKGVGMITGRYHAAGFGLGEGCGLG